MAVDLIWCGRIRRDVVRAGERVGDIDLGTKRGFLWSQIPTVVASRSANITAAASIQGEK
jgi:hypothetical protein